MTHFDGETYEPSHDRDRLAGQLARVQALMEDGRWRSLAEIAAVTHATEASVSARLRDLRKARFGKRDVQRQRVLGGMFMYRLAPRYDAQGTLPL